MTAITLGADATTVILNGFAITDFVEGDVLTLTPANDLTSHVNGTNGDVTVFGRTDAGVYDLGMRVKKYSPSDVFLNSARNRSVPEIFNGSAKESYRRNGNDQTSTWILENGSITTQPTDTRNNQEGNAVMEYTIRFRNAQRSI